MGASEKVAATFHPDPEPGHACTDCGAIWSAKAAADECAILDAVETRKARNSRG